jgi:hypothetical protein
LPACNSIFSHADNKTTVFSRDPAGEKFMSTIFKIILGTAIAAASIASPALAQAASEKGQLVSARKSGHVRTANHRSALRSFASTTRGVDDPASTGGGSIGYNMSLRLNHW